MPAPEHSLRDTPAAPPREPPGTPDPLAAQSTALDTPYPRRERILVCATCRAHVTSPTDGIDMNGAHSHAFLNPAGVIYRIRCFRAAPGVAGLGEPSDVWTWFPGFHWRACMCCACFEHLGWRFQSPATTFFGLITERLLELDEAEPGASN